jgi:phage shock protein PspC (stress-responsive transcriptional regulator)
MQKVIIINLNGNAYQLDEDAYNALRAYLDDAGLKLASNPDKAEIVGDLEQAIAEKCMRFLNPHKTVVTLVEIDQVLKEMGPVEGQGTGDSVNTGTPKAGAAAAEVPRRLYRIRETGMVGGICAGLGAYLDVDPTIVRIIFVLVAILTHGVGVLVYIVLMFIIPVANTSEERAAAHGLPFTAQELVDQAKAKYSAFHDKAVSKAWWKPKKKVPVATAAEEPWVAPPSPVMAPMTRHVGYGTQLLIGVFIPVFAIIRAALGVVLVLGIISLVNYRAIFGLRMPPNMPLWAGVLVLIFVYQVIVTPFRIIRHSWSYSYLPYGHVGAEVWGGIIWLGFLIFFLFLAYEHAPMFREFLDRLPDFEPHWLEQAVLGR